MTLTPHTADADFTLYHGDALEVLRQLPAGSCDAVVTSPPYLDARPEYPAVDEWATILAELARVTAGPLLFNVGRLWRDGVEVLWWLDLITAGRELGLRHLDTLVWVKLNANPIRGRVAVDAHEYVLVLAAAGVDVNEDGRRRPYAEGSVERLGRRTFSNLGVKGDRRDRPNEGRKTPNPAGGRAPSYIVASTGAEKGNPHPAPMPIDVALELVALAAPAGAVILDPFCGSGTTAIAARQLGRRCIGIERDEGFCRLACERLGQYVLAFDYGFSSTRPILEVIEDAAQLELEEADA